MQNLKFSCNFYPIFHRIWNFFQSCTSLSFLILIKDFIILKKSKTTIKNSCNIQKTSFHKRNLYPEKKFRIGTRAITQTKKYMQPFNGCQQLLLSFSVIIFPRCLLIYKLNELSRMQFHIKNTSLFQHFLSKIYFK